MNTMVVVDQQQPPQSQQGPTFAPLSAVQPPGSVGLINGCVVDGFVLSQQQQQQQQQKQQSWVQSPTTSASGIPSNASANTKTVILNGGPTNATNAPSHPTKMSLPICSGCGQPILDKYVLHVAPDATWHADCLRCAECSQPLDETCTCYVRNGHAYCKNDYTKLFGVRCARCQKSFSRLDSIMKVRSPTTGANVLFHAECFMCYACGCPLVPGSRFALLGGGPDQNPNEMALLLCERDFDDRPPHHFISLPQPPPRIPGVRPGPPPVVATPSGPMLLPGDSTMIENHHPFMTQQHVPHGHLPHQALHHMGPTPADGIVMLEPPQSQMTLEGLDAGQSQAATTQNLVHRGTLQHHHINNSSGNTSGNKHHGNNDHKVCEKTSSVSSCGSASTGGNGSMSTANKQLGGSTRSRESKTTRVRTVLNEKQLNTLRACYAANPRPDALMKEQLVEMTGLSPRVIRVWFQNKRCKDKKKSILMKLQAQHLSNSDKVAALQSAMPMIAQDAMQHSGESPVNGSEVQIHSFSQSAWKSLADFAMNADIEPSASFQQFVNGVDGNSKMTSQMRPRGGMRPGHQPTSDGISDVDDDEVDDNDDEVLGGADDDDDMVMMGGCSSTSPTRGGATTTTTTTTTTTATGDDESASGVGPFGAPGMSMELHGQRQQLLVDTAPTTMCNRL